LSDQQTGDAVPKPKEPPIAPLVPWLVYQIKRKCHERRAQREKETAEERSSHVTARATVVIAFSAIVTTAIAIAAAIIANRTLTAIQGQLGEMRAERLINIAQTRANLVRDAIAHAHTDGKKLAAVGEKIVEYSFSPSWKNTGSTDARAWRGWFDLKAFDIGPTIPRHLGSNDCPRLDTPNPSPDERIIPRDGIVIQLAKFISIDDLTATVGDSATKFILMWGHMEFQDIYFPETPIHSDDWCVSIAPADLRQQSFSYISLKETVK
jgi:hypothetical protein